ncbi:prepilin peptidase [Sphingomonas rubra]|uniref:Prepilin leader peptidase/N-methyltransferase n=1 Tax=Sphingomonas rubra TaxID=634430 RepID=A0A1I5PS62_9SPHN|nr:A24 family peptidase [Sphingomonas rubra]SFP36757.1 leader peptidase (prepilin peptidase) / N-methyltransferase [Sphingomonas rubra]
MDSAAGIVAWTASVSTVHEPVAWALALGLLGAIAGSFLAALVVRWPEERSVMRGRSACDACGRTLGPAELVPLLSALVSRGRCRGCGEAIDPVHSAIEAAAVAVGAASGWLAPGVAGVGGALFGWLLVALAVLDWRHFWLPDRLVAVLALGGLGFGLAGVAPALPDRLIGGAGGFLLLWGIAAGYRWWRGREGMGGGDPKLFGAVGLWLGWRLLPAVLLVAGLIGLGIVAWRAATGRGVAADDALPLGTLIAAAAYPGWAMMVGVAP